MGNFLVTQGARVLFRNLPVRPPSTPRLRHSL